jgi:hypothetical protein
MIKDTSYFSVQKGQRTMSVVINLAQGVFEPELTAKPTKFENEVRAHENRSSSNSCRYGSDEEEGAEE